MQSLNALFIVGGPGSGKDFLLRTIQEDIGGGLHEIPLDKLYKAIKEQENLPELADNPPLIVNGIAEDYNQIRLTKAVLEAVGYETAMVYVFTTNEVSQDRNNARINNGSKTISEDVRQTKYDASFRNLVQFKEDFSQFVLFDNSGDYRTVNEEQKAEIVGWIIELQETIQKFFINEEELSLDEQFERLVEGEKDRSPFNTHRDLLDTANNLRSGKGKTMGMHGYTSHNNHSPNQVQSNIKKTAPKKPGGGLSDYFSHNRVKTGLNQLKEGVKSKLSKSAKAPSQLLSTNVGAPYGATQVQGTAQTAVTESFVPHFEGPKGNQVSDTVLHKIIKKHPDLHHHVTQYMQTRNFNPAGKAHEVSHSELYVKLKKLEESNVDEELSPLVETYEDWGWQGGYGIMEGRAVSLNKPFRRSLMDHNLYSVYFLNEEGIIARTDFDKAAFMAEELVHVHGYGVISRERAKQGYDHHMKMVAHYTQNNNQTMAKSHSELAVHFHNAVVGKEHK